MRRYQQHTHASWHRAYGGKAQCPWCHEGPRVESRPQSSAHHKRPAKRPDTGFTNRTDVPSPRAARSRGHSIKQPDQSPTDRTAQFEPHSDPAPDTADDAEDSPEPNSHYKYMGRTVRHEGLNGVFALDPPRPRLPEAWTHEEQDPDLGPGNYNESAVENWRSEVDASGDRGLDEEKAGLMEPDVKELEND